MAGSSCPSHPDSEDKGDSEAGDEGKVISLPTGGEAGRREDEEGEI